MPFSNGDDTALDAEIDGRKARREGRPKTDNPHFSDLSLRRFWTEGWNDEDRELRAAAPVPVWGRVH